MKKLTVLCLALAFALNMQAQNKPVARLNHVSILVANLKVATDFYHDLFELTIGAEPFHDGKHTWFDLGDNMMLHVIQGGERMVYQKNEHLCFSVGSVEVFVKELNARHIDFEDAKGKAGTVTARPDGVKQIYFKDPDGHWIEVNDAK